jgi:hypothetical protein
VLLVLDRPVMIDDTLFLKAAAQILRDPLRPYDFAVNWYGTTEWFWNVFKNPPGVSYWLAAAQALGATSDVARHVAMLPFAVAALLGGLRLARRFVGAAAWTTAMWAASPAFVVAAASLMADVPALAASLWGVAFWIEGVDDGDSRRRRLGALLVGVAFVLKYTALVSVGALVLYVFAGRERRRGLSDLWVASLPAFAWGLLTLGTMERVHVIDALVVGGGGFSPNPGWFGHRAIALLTFFAGAAVAPVVLVVARRFDRRAVTLAGIALVLGVVVAIATPWLWSPRGLSVVTQAAAGVLGAAGALALLGALDEGRGDRDSRFLALWVLLHVVYLWLWSWTIAARFILPALVPLALLLARRIERERAGRSTPIFALATGLALVAAILLVRADSFTGEIYRRALPGVAAQARAEGRKVYFVGSWGFQHYAESAGFERLDANAPPPRIGALVLQPYYAGNNELPPTLAPRLREIGDLTAPAPPFDLHTMNINVGAGYHSSVFGPLPCARAHLPAEGIKVWLVAR